MIQFKQRFSSTLKSTLCHCFYFLIFVSQKKGTF